MTVLFADLVGFTSRAEQLDPEDVRAVLEPYHARLRTELERRGGTVEKFIGDAVMALFGAPTAHEDDPERAVRAALAIRDWIREQGELQVRIAITTGEALVALGARPAEGEGMASGDVVNTAARLQSAAPVNGILVDETTYRATSNRSRTSRARRWRPRASREPVAGLGSRSRHGRATASTSRGSAERLSSAASSECELLRGRARSGRARRTSPQLVTLVGVPGIGKSRLVAELFCRARTASRSSSTGARADACPTAKASPTGRSSEMVKAHAGILETDTRSRSKRSSRQVVAEALDGDVRPQWVEGHLRPLVGRAEAGAHGSDRSRGVRRLATVLRSAGRAEPAGARLRGSALGGRQPARLHRPPRRLGGRSADARRLYRSPRAPLAPPRLGRRQAERGDDLALAALRRRDRAPRRMRCSSGRSCRPRFSPRCSSAPAATRSTRRSSRAWSTSSARTGATPAARVGAGNHRRPPRRASDRGEAPAPGRGGGRQGLLARRRSSGSATATARDAELLLHGLERKEFVRRERRSSVGEESQYVFSHLLVRDVAYSQIPRADASEKHQARGRVDRVARSTRGPRRDARAPLPDRARARSSGRTSTRRS